MLFIALLGVLAALIDALMRLGGAKRRALAMRSVMMRGDGAVVRPAGLALVLKAVDVNAVRR
jgi:hypothetical protein